MFYYFSPPSNTQLLIILAEDLNFALLACMTYMQCVGASCTRYELCACIRSRIFFTLAFYVALCQTPYREAVGFIFTHIGMKCKENCFTFSLFQVGVTKIGSPEANIPQDIQLVGSHILAEHCTFKNTDGIITFEPAPNANCYVNGRKVFFFIVL